MLIDYKILLKEYMRTIYKIYGEFPDVDDLISIPNTYHILKSIEIDILEDSKKLSNTIVNLGTVC